MRQTARIGEQAGVERLQGQASAAQIEERAAELAGNAVGGRIIRAQQEMRAIGGGTQITRLQRCRQQALAVGTAQLMQSAAVLAHQCTPIRAQQQVTRAGGSRLFLQPCRIFAAIAATVQFQCAEGIAAAARVRGEGWHRALYTVKDDPHPQVDLALGLRMTNCDPLRFSA